MNARKLDELAIEADALAAAVPLDSKNPAAFDVWLTRWRGLAASLTIDGAFTPSEWLKGPLPSSALGDLIGGLRVVWQYSRVYSPSNHDLVATGLRTISKALRTGTPITNGGIFISFSHADEVAASQLFDALDAAGLSPFKASDPAKGLRAGEGYFENLLKKLREVESLVLLATPSSVVEAWPVFEAGAIAGRGCPVLSICVGVGVKDLPGPLGPIQAVVASDRTKVKHFLAQIIARDVDEIWTGDALVKLDAFLDAAHPRLKPGQSTVAKVVTEHDPYEGD